MIYAMLLVAGFLMGVALERRRNRRKWAPMAKRIEDTLARHETPTTLANCVVRLEAEGVRARFESRFRGLALVHPCPREGTDHVHAPGGVCIHTVRAWLDREGLGAWEPRWDEGARRFGFVRVERSQ